MKIKKDLFDLLKESSYKQLDVQVGSVESIEAKTVALLAAILAIPTILVAIAAMSGISPSWNNLLTIGSLLLLVSIAFVVKSLLCRDFSMPAEIDPFLAENKRLASNKIRINFLDDCRKSIKLNIERLKTKGRDFNLAMTIFVLAVLLIVGGIIKGNWFKMTKDNSQQSGTQTQQPQPTQSPQPSNNPAGAATPAPNSGLPDDRQGTTLNIFKGSDDYTKK